MTRATAHYLPKEMALLGLVESALSFCAICFVFLSAGASLPDAQRAVSSTSTEIALALGLTLILVVVAMGNGLYRPDIWADSRRLTFNGAATLSVFGLLLLSGCAIHGRLDAATLLLVLSWLAGWGIAIAIVRFIHLRLVGRRPLARRILLAGDTGRMTLLNNLLLTQSHPPIELVLLHERDWSWDELRRRRIWAIVLASKDPSHFGDALIDCKLRGMRVLSAAAFQETVLGRIDIDSLTTTDLLTSSGFRTSWLSEAVKRLTDIVLASGMLVLTLPLTLVTAALIKLDSPGPVLYTQKRVGRSGKVFTLLKFRSMTANAEAGGAPRWAQKQDPRITRVGRFIRKNRIDELPQLLNIIRGEMSLVGPRPERPHFVDELARAIPFYQHRTYVKPGLTGWAQVNFPYGASVEDAREKLCYDLYYVKNRSFLLDMIILFATIRVVLNGEGAR